MGGNSSNGHTPHIELPLEMRERVKTMHNGADVMMEQQLDGSVEPSVIIKGPLDPMIWARCNVEYGKFDLRTYIPEGPIIRMVLRVHHDLVHPERMLVFSAFLNPADDIARAMLRSWSKAHEFVIHGFDRGNRVRYLGSKHLPWTGDHRGVALMLLRRTEGMPTLWPDAMNRWKEDGEV